MPLETFGYIDDLDPSSPDGATEYVSQGDDHIKGIKLTLQNTFPNLNGAVTPTPAQLNVLANAFIETMLASTSAAGVLSVLGVTLPYMWLTGGCSAATQFCVGGATRYADFAHGSAGQVSESGLTAFRAPAQGRLSNFRLRAGANTIGASSTATIRVNGVDTALSLSFNTLQASNTADTVNVSAGDVITIGFVGGGSSGSATGGAWSMKFEAWSW